MMEKTMVIGIDVSRDWLDGFGLSGLERFRLANSAEGHKELILMIRQMSGPVHVGFEATGGQEWALWAALVEAGISTRQLPPAQIKAFAMSRGTRAKTDRIDAELIARFMLFRPEAGRTLPSDNLRILRTLTTRRAQIVDMRKRLSMQIAARQKQGISADVEDMDDVLKALLDTQIGDIESRIESVIAQEETTAVKANLLRSIPGIGPVSAAMLIAEMPELGRMTSGEAAAMTGLAPVPHDSGVMRGRRAIAGGRRALRRVLFQAALAAAYHNPMLKPVAQRLKERGKPHKLVIIAIARRLIAIANAILKTGETWRHQPGG
ncbi:IS110 family transposase [Thalassospira sp. GB04J01]|uniref:IS110 family transposase n=1 Tax=Thalassospira sp. GB04J01 TaxID=1485225 RepID=UPI001FCAAAFC|nr:IS110 family transposase [Thalassospira sp. GB04J01]|tara:strand:- start:14653 stop:15615 length:963 start_codon:yes stop_codon:yes gene_type:complete